MKTLMIVGGGASGVYLSILVKQRIKDMEVIILEQNSSSLKKLLATGNGRCNLSNKNMSIDNYHCDDNQIVDRIIHSFDMVKAMNDIGLLCQYQGDLLYPRTQQALSVKNILLEEAKKLGVLFIYEQEVVCVQTQSPYKVITQDSHYQADYVVFAMGSEAGKLSGIQSSRYDILKKLGLKVIPSFPSLVQMNTKPVLKQLKGVRVRGTFSLLENNKCIHKEKGELLFTDYGVSGIAIMQLSAFYKKNHSYEISMDFFDDMSEEELVYFIENRKKKGYNHFYDGLIHSKLSLYLEKLNLTSSSQMVQSLKDMRLKVTGLRDFENAQVMKGGLSLHEVDSSLELKKYPQIYAMGEILNVTGLCGGYNLHFALASAYQVAKAIERKEYAKNS